MAPTAAKINTNLWNSHESNSTRHGINGREVQKLVEKRASCGSGSASRKWPFLVGDPASCRNCPTHSVGAVGSQRGGLSGLPLTAAMCSGVVSRSGRKQAAGFGASALGKIAAAPKEHVNKILRGDPL